MDRLFRTTVWLLVGTLLAVLPGPAVHGDAPEADPKPASVAAPGEAAPDADKTPAAADAKTDSDKPATPANGNADAEKAPAPSADELAALVRQLGDASYQRRTAASDRLLQIGLAAHDALIAALKDPDPEIRRRARWVLADVMEADHRRRLEAFVADTDPANDHGLPGWTRFRRIVGEDKPARELFVEMHRSDAGLLASAAIGPGPAAESLSVRFQQVYRLMAFPDPTRRVTPQLGTVAALLFVSTDPDLELPEGLANSSYLQNMIHQAEFQNALRDGPYKPAARKLLGQWILRPGNVNLLTGKLQMAVQYDLPQGLYLAVAALKDEKNKPPGYMLGYAVSAVGAIGGKDHAARLAALLDDESECTRVVFNNQQTSIQVRDVALAWLVHLTGQKLEDYGLEQAKQEFERMSRSGQRYVNFASLRFDKPERRKEAIPKFKAWLKEHPLPDPPELPEPDRGGSGKPATGQAVVVQPQPAAAPPGVKAPQEPIPPSLALAPAARTEVRALGEARELAAGGRFAEAAGRLGRILAAPADSSFQPDLSVPLYRCLKPEAERLLAELPAAVREAYQSLFEAQARAVLAQAVRDGDARQLSEVSTCYFHTPAGAEATYLLAMDHLDRGRPLRAALYLERLRSRSLEANRYEPGLSLVLAACWVRTGMPEAAQKVLDQMRAAHPNVMIEVAGREHALFADPKQSLTWLESLIGPSPKAAAAAGWPMFRGGPSRNVQTQVACPFLDAKPAAPLSSDPLVRKTAERLLAEQRGEFRVALPRLYPLVVGKSVVLRTATELQAIGTDGGGVDWEAPLEDPLRHFLKHADDRQKEAQSDDFSQGLERRLWRDTSFGTLASDGRLVFGVEDLDFGFRADYQQTVVGPDGRRRLDPTGQKDYNLLVAYDLATGKARWEIGGPPDIEGAQLAGAYFLGAPLPLGGRLYVVADVKNETQILELDADTGRLTWQLTLAVQEKDPQNRALQFLPMGLAPTSHARSTASPSYADGVLVCRTSDDQFVGVDLTTRSVQWIYQTPEPETDLGAMLGNAWMRRIREEVEASRNDDWADSSVTIAQGRILLTPPHSGELLCLDLSDGHLAWSVPRHDGLFVACVHDGRVVIVGRGSLWAVKLADGTPAWTEPSLALPADALPSGRGLLSGARYFLPLTTAEVAVVDVAAGRIASRSRSPGGVVPGNLVACNGTVLSQNADGLRRFPTLEQRIEQTTKALAQKPNDPQALTDQGEVLLCQGRLVEAVDHLRRANEIRSDERTRRLLIDALEDGLQTDFATFRELAVQLDPVFSNVKVRWRFLRQLALAHQQAGEIRVAFETCLKLADAVTDDATLEHISAARIVRRDRWTAARLAELYAAATPQDRDQLGRLVLARLRDDRLPEFLTYFPFHPAANEARLRLAAQLDQKSDAGRAECLLREVFATGDKLQQRTAVARLADLLRRCAGPEDAAAVYRYLAGPLADEVCADGKTGRQLVEQLEDDSPVRRAMAHDQPWPEGKPKVEVVEQHAGIPTRYPVEIAGNNGPLDRPVFVQIDSGGSSLLISDEAGRKLGEVQPEQKQHRWGFNSVMLSYAHGRMLGHTLVAWLGNRVCAVDTLQSSARVLWVEETVTEDPPVPGMAMFMPWRMQMFRQPKAAGASDFRSLVVTPRGVFFQQDRRLVAVDPLRGQVLFSRNDLEENCDLFGDEEMIFVTPPGAREAAVYSAVDGRELGWRRVPDSDQRLAILGRRLLIWVADDRGPRLQFLDPWSGEVLWEKTFDASARPWMIDSREVAVLDRAGHLAVFQLPDGQAVVQAELKPLPGLDEVVVLRNGPRYVVLANQPGGQQVGAIIRQTVPGNVAVNGPVWGVDRATGKVLWNKTITDQAMRADQPSGLPLLACFNTLQRQEGNRFRTTQSTLLLDTRNGNILHQNTREGSSGQQLEITLDLDNARIEVRTYRETIKLTYSKSSAAK